MLIRIFFMLQFLFTVPLIALTDQSNSLEAILEHGTLSKKDCDKYFAGQKDRETMLRCGKWQYFFDSLGVPGLPAPIVDLVRDNARETVGRSLEKFGFFSDPYSKSAMPVGFTPGPKLFGGVSTYTPTCGSCHFGKLSDGRYVVGQPNHDLEFSKLVLAVSVLPELGLQPKKVQPEEVNKALGPMKAEFFNKSFSKAALVVQVLRLLPKAIKEKIKPLDDQAKINLAVMPSGVLDVFTPLNLDDKIDMPQRILPTWGLPTQEEMVAAGSTHGAMLTSNGGPPDLVHIIHAIRDISSLVGATKLKDAKDDAYTVPLIAYIMSLQPPKNLKLQDPAQLESGKNLFAASCSSCHNGPGYVGTKIFDVAEIGTDPNIKKYLDPDLSGKLLYPIGQPYELTQGIRAARLSGVWSMKRILHNGSLNSLEELFCLNGPRPAALPIGGMSTAGHESVCETFTREEKEDVIAFLKSL